MCDYMFYEKYLVSVPVRKGLMYYIKIHNINEGFISCWQRVISEVI